MTYYEAILHLKTESNKGLAILIDPEDFERETAAEFLRKLPKETTHIFVGGSTASHEATKATVLEIKNFTSKPVLLFPGDYSQLTNEADAVLFLSLLSGRNVEYLIGQQLKSVSLLQSSSLEIIPTGYILVDGGNVSAVELVSNTKPLAQLNEKAIVETALAGQYMGAKLIYLEAGSGARVPVHGDIISKVKKAINVPLIVGGGIRTEEQKQLAYDAGADMVVMGTVFEENLKVAGL